MSWYEMPPKISHECSQVTRKTIHERVKSHDKVNQDEFECPDKVKHGKVTNHDKVNLSSSKDTAMIWETHKSFGCQSPTGFSEVIIKSSVKGSQVMIKSTIEEPQFILNITNRNRKEILNYT